MINYSKARVSEMEADHIVRVASLLYGDDEGFRGVEDVGNQTSRLRG